MKFLLYISAAALVLLLIYRWRHSKKRHQWYIRRAMKVYDRINKERDRYTSAQVFRYLRHVNPYVFEELLLLALSHKGYKVIHNRRYSGDGGIDGRVVINGKRIPIQAKRYTSYIRREHVVAFARLVQIHHKPFGLFIHTGKTGSVAGDPSCDYVRIVSGENLLNLLYKDRPFIIPS
ncbi:MAG: restriction endonuclease [Bacteroidaceae bacterium]|nr:restriction endonuclease [Bacteroidaceae bacterium]